MALNASGPISLGGSTSGQSIALELSQSATGQISLNDTNVRSLAGVSSGAITVPTNFWGKSSRPNITYTYTADTKQSVLNLLLLPGYVAGISDITVTVDVGVYVWSDDVNVPAITFAGGTTGDTLKLINYGYIMGKGATGGEVTPTGVAAPAGPGGPAITLGFDLTIDNTFALAYIGGGGGGGGCIAIKNSYGTGSAAGGGGAGGGAGGRCVYNGAYYAGGSGGAPGNSGTNGTAVQASGLYPGGASGGGGGRIFPGVTLTGPTSGNTSIGGYGNSGGGTGAVARYASTNVLTGGSGGAAGVNGGNGSIDASNYAGGGGGGYGANGGNGLSQLGSSGGKAVNLNGYLVTWVAGNTARVYGAVS